MKTISQINCSEELTSDDLQLLQKELSNLGDTLNEKQPRNTTRRGPHNSTPLNNQKSLFEPMKMSTGRWAAIAIMIIATAALFVLFFLPKEKIPLPNFSIEQNSELPGEEIIRGSSSDTDLIATVTDQIDAKEDNALGSRYLGSDNIWIRFDNDKVGSKSAKLTTTIIREGQEPQIQKDTLYPHIRVDDLPYGETKFTIIAENATGKVEKTLTITKTTHRAACDADPANQTYKYCSHFYKTENKPAPTLPNYSGPNTSSGCAHYEAQQCWDEIEDEAYEKGQWDRDFGSYGGGYNPPDGCTGICEDIYDEAYTQGYGW